MGSTTSDNIHAIKRQRNTIAARRYRQKGRDRITELEAALKEVTEERDQLRLQLARKEAEVDALRQLLK
nr:L-amino acid oxidase [Colletotrichum truncatum]KAF6783360.1 L-amino acid oxidase [Colletotrichum truncatum]